VQAMLVGGPPPGRADGSVAKADTTVVPEKRSITNKTLPGPNVGISNPELSRIARKTATVWAWSGYTSDSLDLCYAANANSPAWVFIKTIKPTKAGAQSLSATFTLRRVHCRRFARNSDIREVHRLAPQEPVTITTT
jgi:hypothetical protein